MRVSVTRLSKLFFLTALTALATAALILHFAVEYIGAPPRSLGPYIERRASGHNPFIVGVGTQANQLLSWLDRAESQVNLPPSLRVGAQPTGASSPVAINKSTILVASSAEAFKAIDEANPGDVITFLPGTYRLEGRRLEARRAGTRERNITVRAEKLDSVFLNFNMTEGFVVSAPYWTFENLNITGICKEHSDCEHAFHVVGDGSHFTARNNRISDFNAHFKINGFNARFPDHGVIEGNTLSNRTPRDTINPVTLIDLVAASHWRMRNNLIADFVKAGGDQVSYGAFAKGAGMDNRFEQNAVFCEYHLSRMPGQQVGLSLGGGGTGKQYCRDGRCITEQDASVIQSNLIAYCSDDGIYINRAATSKILHNTLVDTGGVSVRFAESSADVEGNLLDGAVRSRDGGIIRLGDNSETPLAHLYLGHHPVRQLFASAEGFDFTWKKTPPRRENSEAGLSDLCGASRPSTPTYGAFENFSECLSK